MNNSIISDKAYIFEAPIRHVKNAVKRFNFCNDTDNFLNIVAK